MLSKSAPRGRVAIIQNYYTPYRHDLFKSLAAMGFDVHVLYAQLPSDEGRQWRAPQVEEYRVFQSPRFQIGKVVLFVIPLIRIIRERPVVVLLDNNPTNIMMVVWGFLLKLLNIKTLVWVEHIPDSFKSKLKLQFQKTFSTVLAKMSNAALVFSDMSAEYVRDLKTGIKIWRTVQAAEGMAKVAELSSSSGIEGEARTKMAFGFIGSNTERKNVQALLEAFDNGPCDKAELHVAGFELSEPWASRSNVIGYGYVEGEARERFFRSIDCLILPSFADPWGMVVNEAMARGCVCIVSDQCGSSELVRKLDPRLVVPANVDGIRSGLDFVAGLNSTQLTAMKCGAGALVMDYTIEKSAEGIAVALTALTSLVG